MARYAALCDQSNADHWQTAVTTLTGGRWPLAPPQAKETWSTSGLLQTMVRKSAVWNVEPISFNMASYTHGPGADAMQAQRPRGGQRGVAPKVTETWTLRGTATPLLLSDFCRYVLPQALSSRPSALPSEQVDSLHTGNAQGSRGRRCCGRSKQFPGKCGTRAHHAEEVDRAREGPRWPRALPTHGIVPIATAPR